jgi:hypothetical protein
MSSRVRERLQEIINRSTRLVEGIGLVGLGFLGGLPDRREMIKPGYWSHFAINLGPNIAPFVLIFVTVFWYYRFKGAATKELVLIDNLFDEDRSPIHGSVIAWYKWLPIIGYLIVAIFCALLLLTPYISLYCMAAFVLHANDLMGQAIMAQNLNKTLLKFPVSPENPRAKFANERREAVIEYYYDNPTFPRIVAIFFVTATAFIISVELAPARPNFYLVSYALMVANVLVSEFVIERWRMKRDRKLDDIARREELEVEKAIHALSGGEFRPT